MTFPVEMQEGKKRGMNTKLCMSKDSAASTQLLQQGPPETDLSSDLAMENQTYTRVVSIPQLAQIASVSGFSQWWPTNLLTAAD